MEEYNDLLRRIHIVHCSRCDGHGTIPEPYCVIAGKQIYQSVYCHWCNGFGKVYKYIGVTARAKDGLIPIQCA
jgi:DnaJ-class molecular chaperone